MARNRLSRTTAFTAATMMALQPVAGYGQVVGQAGSQVVTAGPQDAASGFAGDVRQHFTDPSKERAMSRAQLVAALRQKVKYVFVIFQENRSFDHYFGTFPGANGLFADAGPVLKARATPLASNTQQIYGTDGKITTVSSFRIGTEQNAADLDDVDHGHARMAAKMDLSKAGPGQTGTPAMDRFALDEQTKYFPGSPIDPVSSQVPAAPSLRSKQFGELAMAYVDCDTIPFMWNYANRFTLFDNIFQTTIGPSTPNAIAMISGQAGETQWVKHPDQTSAKEFGSVAVPITNDPLPGLPTAAQKEYSGKASEPTNATATKPTGPAGAALHKIESNAPTNVAPNLTFASLPLSFMGKAAKATTDKDTNPSADLPDIQADIAFLSKHGTSALGWGWYQNGYDTEPGLPAANAVASTPHASYIGHHNGPQYFGYVTSNPGVAGHMHGLGDFYTDLQKHALPAAGGVFYVRGGYDNIQGLVPDTSHATGNGPITAQADKDYITANMGGDDDHPGYSDSQISEAMMARAVNAIAASPYWGQSAIVVTYDESEGDYDHVPPRILSWDPAGLPLSRGPRIPLLVISPYARVHAVSHEEGDHNSVIGLIDTLFGLTPLADLPDEASARVAGEGKDFATAGVKQMNLGPHDGIAHPTEGTGRLLSAFDPGRLSGKVPPLPASYAMTDVAQVSAMPHYRGAGCKALGITPVDAQLGIKTTIPADFFARPGQTKN
jgi:phospholipase C